MDRLVAQVVNPAFPSNPCPDPAVDIADLDVLTTFVYDGLGRLIEQIDPMGRRTKMVYDGLGRPTQQVVNHTSTEANTRITTQIDYRTFAQPNGKVLELEIVTRDNPVRETRTLYDARRRPVHIINNPVDGSTATDENVTTDMRYDMAGNVLWQRDPNGIVTNFQYDELNRRTVVDSLNANGGTSATRFSYDGIGNIRYVTDPFGKITSLSYDRMHRQSQVSAMPASNALSLVTQTTYSKLGYPILETDPNNVTRMTGYDALGRVTCMVENYRRATCLPTDWNQFNDPSENEWTFDVNVRTDFQYDGVGNLKQLSHPPELDPYGSQAVVLVPPVIRYGYDRLDRRTSVDGPLEIINDLWTTKYDKAGRITERTTPDGVIITSTLDDLDRVTGYSYSDGVTPAVTFDYSTPNKLTVQDGLGAASTFVFDRMDRLLSSIDQAGNTVQYSYALNGRLASMQYPGAAGSPHTVSYEYYPATNLLWTVTGQPSGTTTYFYDELNRPRQVHQPNGIRTQYEYDDLSRLEKIVYIRPGAPNLPSVDEMLMEITYTLDGAGNRKTVHEKILIPPPTSPASV